MDVLFAFLSSDLQGIQNRIVKADIFILLFLHEFQGLFSIWLLAQNKQKEVIKFIDDAFRSKGQAINEEPIQRVILLPGLRPFFDDLIVLVIFANLRRDLCLLINAEADSRVEFGSGGCVVKNSRGVEKNASMEDVIVNTE